MEHDGLNNPHPVSNAILTLLTLLEEKAEAAGDLHEAEWALVVRRGDPERKAV